MNGDELRFLAERSWAIEDRTAERLADVHARIAEARRRRVTRTVATVAVVLVVLVTGVALTRAGSDVPSPAPAPKLLSPNPLIHKPAEGTCWDVPSTSVVDQTYWVDDSPQVPCDQEHTTETVAVLVVNETTATAAKERAAMCWDYVRRFVGVDPDSWIPWAAPGFLPSQEQIDEGASWIRCDLAFPTSWLISDVRTTSGSGAGLADEGPVDLWACLDRLPTDTVDEAYVPCDEQHTYEATGTLALLDPDSEYPSVAERAAAVEEQCGPDVPARFRGTELTATWDPESSFVAGDEVAGACFVYNADKTPLPAR